ncbi:hypothetical protein GO986_09075 [Deinococcus sp. HMF7620]|uniref:Uncharacterized protein n=1 Tax=Deinococcus arboris TaxID=2682977 RepID=A0A7C9LN67_9DEIO|nr:hypothetical protein [Deinococcus arboris]MVN86916.1 hypothetical protein [Deinococcus arboris]
MTTEQRGVVVLRVAGGLIVRVSGPAGKVTAVRVEYPAPTTVAPGDQVTLDGVGGQRRVTAVRRG